MSRFRPSQGAAQLRATPPGGPRKWLSPLTRRRWANFKAHRRGYVSLWLFLILFGLSLFAELIANDRPILMGYRGAIYAPVFRTYPETRVRRRAGDRGGLSRPRRAGDDREGAGLADLAVISL